MRPGLRIMSLLGFPIPLGAISLAPFPGLPRHVLAPEHLTGDTPERMRADSPNSETCCVHYPHHRWLSGAPCVYAGDRVHIRASQTSVTQDPHE